MKNIASGSIGLDSKGLAIEKSSSTQAGPTPSYDKKSIEKGESTTVHMEVDASNKLVTGAPAINYDINITVLPKGNGLLDYKIKGASDGFPAYEFFITNEATGKSQLSYVSSPSTTEAKPTALFPPMETKINKSGTIIIDK